MLYIGRSYRYPPDVAFYIFFQQMSVLNILNMLHTLRFLSSKCRLFHNATFFGSCIIHILHTGCAKNLNVKLRCQKVNVLVETTYGCSNYHQIACAIERLLILITTKVRCLVRVCHSPRTGPTRQLLGAPAYKGH